MDLKPGKYRLILEEEKPQKKRNTGNEFISVMVALFLAAMILSPILGSVIRQFFNR